MLKKRIAACLPVYNGIIVQSIGFKKYLPVGKPAVALEFLNKWGVDEIILIDITSRIQDKPINFNIYRSSSQRCHVPLTIGGGINSLSDVNELMHCGADKVSLNTALYKQPELITQIAKAYGDQCVVVSIDAKRDENGQLKVYDYLTGKLLDKSPAEAARQAVELGAGEIFINSVDRDGSYTGYDLELVNSICDAVHIPVIAAGGAKNADDMLFLLQETSVSAACAGNFFHFSEHSVNIAKRNLKNKGIDLRLETHADYAENSFDAQHRLLKKDDATLEHLLYIHIEKEVI
jgi:imidazole glycerol-phosphate synthase subunit HisF